MSGVTANEKARHMNCNVGSNERVVRLSLGIAAAAGAIFAKGMWRIPLALAGVSGIATGLTRYCPVNRLLGIDNCRGMEQISHSTKVAAARAGTRIANVASRAMAD